DVVYNHFGPEGNVLSSFGDYLTDKCTTDWGPAVNFDARGCDPVRSMVLQNVGMWVRDFRFDGLRFDAADQIHDRSCRHILSEAAEAAHEASEELGRHAHIFAETDLNDAPRFLNPVERGGYGFDGHWNDDFHHALHVVLTGEANGYYQDFAGGPVALAKVLGEGFVNNGNYSEFRGRRHGTSAAGFSGDRLVAFTQNHDQVGNRLKSDRYAGSIPPAAVRLAAGILLLSPRLPLLFMGEEYGETSPFPFFCDYKRPDLISAVRKGRQAEFAYFGWKDEVADPFSPSTRDSAVLSWSWDDPDRAGLRALYRDLLRFRREWPALRDFSHAKTRLLGPTILEMVRGGTETPEPLTVVFNLGGIAVSLPQGYASLRPAFRSEPPEAPGSPPGLRPYEFLIFGRPDAS
ncbi:MAG: DUF3459 domain-containing protein, partial [Planctomycetia bacterium]|nr:DUF3459 domain-containing protein [Planctomycetia bacterium]